MIEPTVRLPSALDFEQYESAFEQTGQKSFVLRHLVESGRDLQVEMVVDEDGRKVEWDNLPRTLMLNIEKDFNLLI